MRDQIPSGSLVGPLASALAALTRLQDELGEPLRELEDVCAAASSYAADLYEHLLAAADPRLRHEVGAFYTPIELVHAQTVIVRDLLEHELGVAAGFADPSVQVIDPACGTGAYPLHLVEDTLARTGSDPVARAATASSLARRLVGFELLPGAHAITYARVAARLLEAGGAMPAEGLALLCADPLAIAEQPRLDAHTGVRVCIGNPPWDRHTSADSLATRRGGWIRYGDSIDSTAPLAAFLPGPDSDAWVHAKNLYNDYVYFWCWALHKVIEQSRGGGIVALVTSSSFLRGPGFARMRESLRRSVDSLWILDLGGDTRGPRPSANVFSIQSPVCVVFALRRAGLRDASPAEVWYTKLPDSCAREQKLASLAAIEGRASLAWQRAPTGWAEPLIPAGGGDVATWPRLADLFPWQHSGAQWKRTWPIAETREVLQARWRALLQASDRELAFRSTRDRSVERACKHLRDDGARMVALARLPADTPAPPLARYGFRALDRRWCLADSRLGDFLRPTLWRVAGDEQIFLTTLMAYELGEGPAIFASADVPDLHHFRGSYGGADVLPLWRDARGELANVAPGLLARLSAHYERTVGVSDFACYVYGVMAHPAFTRALHDELAEPGPRVPITKDAELFERVATLGRELLCWHTFGQRMRPEQDWRPSGRARCIHPVSEHDFPEDFHYDERSVQLWVGAGVFAPVHAGVWAYQVSGLALLRSWLGFRMRSPRGKSSSSLDDIRPESWTAELSSELLEVIWVLEASLRIHEQQAAAFAQVLASERFSAAELPSPPATARKPP